MSFIESGIRKFTFFEKQPVLDPAEKGKKFDAFKGFKISCWTPMGDGVLLGDAEGTILQVRKDLQIQGWKAYVHKLNSITLVQSQYIFTVGEEDENSGPIVKLWDLKQWENKNEPVCKVTSRISIGRGKNIPPPAVSIAVAITLDLVCVGLEDTTIAYYYGDLKTDRSYKWKTLREGQTALNEGRMIGIAVASLPNSSIVFSIAENCVQSFQLESGIVVKKVQHDAKGCKKDCWYFSATTNSLALATQELVYFYDAHNCIEPGNEKGRCHALARGAKKLQLLLNGPHVFLLTERTRLIQSSDTLPLVPVLNIYDIEFGYVAFQCPLPPASQMFLFDNEVCLVGTDGIMYRMVEDSLTTKLDILLEKSIFYVAIGLAKRHNSPELKHIYAKYADYLYRKGDFENSIKQYIEIIGMVEPSYVIKKFLDGARVTQLCQYLEALHDKKMANGQHATLLLGAYIKQNAKDKINSFIEKIGDIENFNIEQAIKVLRSTEYSKLAARLAHRHHLYDLYLSILFEDLEDYANAFKFISRQPLDTICPYLEKYGSILIEKNHDAVVEMLRRLVREKPENSRELLRILLIKPDCLEEIYTNEDGNLNIPADSKVCTALLEAKLNKNGIKKNKTLTKEQLNELFGLITHDNAADGARLGRQFNLPALVIHCYQKSKNSEELMRYLLREGNVQQILEVCDEKVLKDMWMDLVTHVSQKEELNTGDLMVLLEKAKTSKYLHPLVVLEILARNDKLKVADIKDYIVNWLKEQNEFIKENEEKIAKNDSEIERMEKRNEELENGVQIFQTNKCSACGSTLQVPAIHFLCNHSFHQHCFDSFSDGKDLCPTCVNEKRREPQSQPIQRELTHSIFQQQLENTTDAIDLISMYIGMGAFQNSIDEK